MIAVRQMFGSRKSEIDAYFDFIQQISIAPIEKIDNNLERTLRASGFLLLYNLIESTVTSAIDEIFTHLGQQRVAFNDCRIELRIVILKHLKQHNPKDIELKLRDMATDVVTQVFKRDKLVSGNVDAKKIRDLASQYGMGKPSANGGDLMSIKDNRNDLAHGYKSFAEVGRDYASTRLLEIKNATVTYLESFLDEVELFLTNKRYLQIPSP